jgi:hypothetical protein
VYTDVLLAYVRAKCVLGDFQALHVTLDSFIGSS